MATVWRNGGVTQVSSIYRHEPVLKAEVTQVTIFFKDGFLYGLLYITLVFFRVYLKSLGHFRGQQYRSYDYSVQQKKKCDHNHFPSELTRNHVMQVLLYIDPGHRPTATVCHHFLGSIAVFGNTVVFNVLLIYGDLLL